MSKFIIKNPIISEKATRLSAQGKYIFLVAPHATTSEVKKAVESIYKVSVVDTHAINMKGKKRRLGSSIGMRPGYKKVVVSLKKGEKLDILPHSA